MKKQISLFLCFCLLAAACAKKDPKSTSTGGAPAATREKLVVDEAAANRARMLAIEEKRQRLRDRETRLAQLAEAERLRQLAANRALPPNPLLVEAQMEVQRERTELEALQALARELMARAAAEREQGGAAARSAPPVSDPAATVPASPPFLAAPSPSAETPAPRGASPPLAPAAVAPPGMPRGAAPIQPARPIVPPGGMPPTRGAIDPFDVSFHPSAFGRAPAQAIAREGNSVRDRDSIDCAVEEVQPGSYLLGIGTSRIAVLLACQARSNQFSFSLFGYLAPEENWSIEALRMVAKIRLRALARANQLPSTIGSLPAAISATSGNHPEFIGLIQSNAQAIDSRHSLRLQVATWGLGTETI